MNTTEMNEVRMFDTVAAYSEEYKVITSKIPGFSEN